MRMASRRRKNQGPRLAIEPLESRCLLAVFTVTTTADSGSGSLRQAILDANAAPGMDRIEFAINQGVQTIRPTVSLPSITNPVVIDGTTQPGFKGMPLIELDGSNAGGSAAGINVSAQGDSTIRGLVINRFHIGISISSSAGRGFNHIAGNFIGTNVTGTVALPNRSAGVLIFGVDNRIGGTVPEDRNLISGNDVGILIRFNRNVVQGNFIGTDISGTRAVRNRVGVEMTRIPSTDASDNLIGGIEPGAGNLISGNTQWGVRLVASTGQSVNRNRVQGNLIGTDVTGTMPLGNGEGIYLLFSASGTIGSLIPGGGNVIAFNRGPGITESSFLNTLQGNVVFGNAGFGLGAGRNSLVQSNWIVANGGPGILVRSSGSTIGGTETDLGNFVGYNAGPGILVDTVVSIPLRGNTAVGNAGPGIELRNGGNNNQPAPEVAGAFTSNNRLFVGGWLFSLPAQRYNVEFFASPECDDSGSGEGEFFLGARAAETDGDGLAVFYEEFDASIPAGWVVTATATDARGNTSAFSNCAAVQDPGGAPGNGLGDVLAALLAGELRAVKRTPGPSWSG